MSKRDQRDAKAEVLREHGALNPHPEDVEEPLFRDRPFFDPRDLVQLRYEMPLSEVVLDFHDRIKSATRGYGSFDYDLIGYQAADLVRLDVMVNGDPVDALSLIVHRDKAFARGVKREDLRTGAELLGLPLDEHIANVIAFMREQADALGLRGSL